MNKKNEKEQEQLLYVFRGKYDAYWHVCFKDGSERDYVWSELHVAESCLKQERSRKVLEYIKQIADLSDLRNEETGEKILAKRFEKLSFVETDVALAKYLNPAALTPDKAGEGYGPIFPFGCNNSQYQAVKSAMENQISVNVYEKLSSSKYDLGFIAAVLGNSINKKAFIDGQDGMYPDFSSWKWNGDSDVLQKRIQEKSMQLKTVFDKREELAGLKQEYSQLVTELEYFKQYIEESYIDIDAAKIRKKLSSKQWMELWQECQIIFEEKQKIGFGFRIKGFLQYGIWNPYLYKQDIAKIITVSQNGYYHAKEAELDQYDLELSTDDTVQVIEEEKVINYPQLTESITVEYTDDNTINESTDYDKLDFVIVKISDNSEEEPKPSITMLKKHLKYPAKFRGTKRFVFNGREAVAFDKPLLVIGSNVEAFNVAGYFYITNRDNFNTMLNFKDVYYRIVDDNAEQIKQAELFDDADDFIADCRNNGRYVTRLTKAILVESFKNVKDNKNKLKDRRNFCNYDIPF